MRKWLHLPVMAERISTGMRLVVLLLFTGFLGQAQDGEETQDGGTLTPITVEEGRSLMHQLLDVDRFIHSLSIGKIAKDTRLVEYAEGFMERNQIEVLTIGYIDSDALWPRVFKNQRLKKIEKADTDDLLVGKIIFVPVEDGEDITGYTVELQLTGKAVSVYELLDVSKEQLDLIAEETTEEELGSTEYAKPKLAQDAVVNAMILALQRVDEVSGGTEDVVINNDDDKKTEYLKFIIDEMSYESGDEYFTMYTNKDLNVRVIPTDTVNRDLSKILWEIEGVRMTPKEDDPTILTFSISKNNLPKSKNDLLVLDSAGNEISKLAIKTYRGPEISFDEAKIFYGQYLFDHGYDFKPLLGDYDNFLIGPNSDTYYAPVLGILKNNYATIRMNVKQLKSEANKDPNFSVVIKPELNGKVLIDGQDSLILNSSSLNTTQSIIISAMEFIDGKNLSSMKIKAYLPATMEQVGMIEYYCAERETKAVDLIFIQFSDEKAYPNYLDNATLESFLNDQSMNQLFLNFEVDSTHFLSSYSLTEVQKWSKRQMLDSLNKEYFGSSSSNVYNLKKDYYYVTNLVVKTSSGGNLGAFHATGEPGGVQLKFQSTAHGETAEEAAVHEFGHWLGLPHTWGTSDAISVIVNPTQGATKDNFMDYKIRRKKWFKRQLLKHNH